jgi:hypothetical protein
VNSSVKRGRSSNQQTNEKRRMYRKAFLSKRIWYSSELFNTPIFYFQLSSSEIIEYFGRNSKTIYSENQIEQNKTAKEILINFKYKKTVKRAVLNHSI